ncbi:hypothetical protein OC861_000774 [Tilletia horrida]|nr:hypothetical protein OC861_000774 [Tilletia horrida]
MANARMDFASPAFVGPAKTEPPVSSSTSLYPNDVCQTNSQCNSGRCTTSQQQKDNYGVNNVILDNRYPPRCDYLNNGQQGCRSFTDCKTGLCQSGTCKLGKDGDRCQVNYNCKHLCGLDGICYTPSGPQPRRSPCKTGTDCLSGNCKFGYSSVNRPNLQSNDPDFFIGVDDTSCAASPLAGACSVDSDCGQGVCSSDNICTLLPIGSSCTDKSQCVTHECYFEPGNYDAGGTCQLASPYTACKRDDQCLSNSCVAQYCRTRDTNPYGYTYYGSCAPVACAASTLNEACRQDSDCGYNGSLGCGANKTCKKTDGQTCSASSECLNGACSNGSCVDPATLKTTTSSTSKTTTKKTTTSKATKTTTSKTTTTTTKSTKSSTTKSKTSTASSSAPSKA